MILKLQNITFGFPGKTHLLDDVSLSLEEMKIYTLMGANGAGKTTLFNLLTGFLKPVKGGIFFQEKDITGLPPFKINRVGISRTFQDLRLISKLTVKENILLAMRHNPTDNWLRAMIPQAYKNESRALENNAEKIAEKFFLFEVENSPAGEISYGQQKLLNLACCVANGASLLLLDEPVAGINPEYRSIIVQLLKHLKEIGKTIFLIEHNSDFVGEITDMIFFLKQGKIHGYETMERFKADPLVLEAYM